MAKAHRLLVQAQGLDPNEAPESVVHLFYYARFHAATAVRLRADYGVTSDDVGESAADIVAEAKSLVAFCASPLQS